MNYYHHQNGFYSYFLLIVLIMQSVPENFVFRLAICGIMESFERRWDNVR